MSHGPDRELRRRAGSALARAVLRLYPVAWRRRYGDEVLAFLEDAGSGPAALLTLALRALPARLWLPRHLQDPDDRARLSLGAALTSGALLAGLGLVFAQLTQLQGLHSHGSPLVAVGYLVFDLAMAFAGLVAAVGGVPLWLLMLRRARRERRSADTCYLLAPVVIPATFLAGVVAVTRVAGGSHGVSQGVFLTVVLGGFGAAIMSCAGVVAALRRLRPRGPAVRLAARAARLAAAALMAAGGASVAALTGLCLRARDFAGYHNGIVLAVYASTVAAFAAAAVVSARRAAGAS